MFKSKKIVAAIACLLIAGNAIAARISSSSLDSVPSLSVVPKPVSLTPGDGHFLFSPTTTITVNDERLKPVAELFADFFVKPSGIDLPVSLGDANAPIQIILVPAAQFGSDKSEAYRLQVTADRVHIVAPSEKGAFYALQTLRQLLPPQVESTTPVNYVRWDVPAVTVEDEPRFPYRGMHLDVARSFMPAGFVKRYIDLLAFHKLNYFHWHLTDDQGWRIPIDAYPLLTEKSAWRDKTVVGHTLDRNTEYDNNPTGGFYTKAEIRDIVAYAAQRQITVIPEIDIPGHGSTIIAAYPEFGCEQQAAAADTFVQPNFGIFPAVLCPTEKTFQMLDTVFTEVAALFPGKYIHVGGDEVLKTQWEQSSFANALMKDKGLKNYHELQSYFVARVGETLARLNRKMIGWNEILDGGVADDATIMSWQGIKGGIAAANLGHDAIMTPFGYTYFDFFQSDSVDEPMAIHGMTTLAKAYSYDPMPEELAGTDKARHILGAQGQLWTEYQTQPRKVEYMVLPRMSALAEVTWTAQGNKDWADYAARLPDLFARYDAMGVVASRSVYTPTINAERLGRGEKANYRITLNAETARTTIRYTTDGSQPNQQSSIYKKPFKVNGGTVLRARAQDNVSGEFYPESRLRLLSHKAVGAEVEILTEFNASDDPSAAEQLTDGISHQDQIYQPSDWVIFYGDSADMVVDLGEPTSVQSVSFTFDAGKHRQLYPPSSVEIFVSSDNSRWNSIATLQESHLLDARDKVRVEFPAENARYVKIVAGNRFTYKSNETGEHRKVPLHIDELVIE
ncbi:glycoside hydrolase family 20 protein [Teredinibacter turnerae]|uniref:glycoside hydrolase family 20 protein n=1 Tax=Teredinibacter turnerae TaxID=2426 RepID=UPI00037554D1|nr:glycoside hydrolase family 20 protein [Teredinibacter turnerae]